MGLKRGKIYLYHAISSYQLLCAMTHARNNCKGKAILILPDFIVEKYPDYERLVELGFFSEVYLFPYLTIEHNVETVNEKVIDAYKRIIPYKIRRFDEIYVWGAHFYFSLYLIKYRKKFVFGEDASGMLQRSEELFSNLSQRFPIHAQIMKKNNLHNGMNKYVKYRMCLIPSIKTDMYFNICDFLEKLSDKDKKAICEFFNVHRIQKPEKGKKVALLLTQQLAGLGAMSEKEQKEVYRMFFDKFLYDYETIYIKKHPDDSVTYFDMFEHVVEISECFPAELIPYIFPNANEVDLYTISSTCYEVIKKYFRTGMSLFESQEKFMDHISDQYKFLKEVLS